MTASSLKLVGSEVSYNINDLNGLSQQIPIPPTTAGNTLVACISLNQTNVTTVSAVTDSASNTWTQRGTTQTSGSGTGHVRTLIFTADNATSASWIKITTSASSTMVTVSFMEWAGCTTVALDAVNGGTATAATSITATNTPTVSGDLVLYVAATGGQSLNHAADGTLALDRIGAPYPTGTAGSGLVASVQAFVGSPANVPLTTTWTGASGNYAWSTVSLKASTPGVGGLTQVFSNLSPVSAPDINQLVNLLNGTTASIPVQVNNRIQAALTGATAQSGYVGATASGSPVSGTFLAGDFVEDQTGLWWICTAGGSPGTWVRVGNGNYIARAHQAATQNFTGSNSLFNVLTDTMDFDPRTMWSAGNNGFIIPFSGARWRIIAGQHITTSTAGRFYVSIQQKRSGVTTEISRGYDGPTAANNAGGVVSDIQQFTSGDLITAAMVSTATGSTVATSAANYLCLALADG